jgi:hypothetical protein
MLQNEISKEQVMHFAEVLKAEFSFDEEKSRDLIKKGLLLYRQGSVYNVKYNTKIIDGRVQDVVPDDVTINLDTLTASSCSCPSPSFCRHRMALFFYVYASFSSVGSLLDEWKTAHQNTSPSILTNSLKKANEIQKRYQDDSITSWYVFFNREYELFLEQNSERDRYIISLIYQRFFQSLSNKAPKNTELKRLFMIHAGIFSIHKTLEIIESLQLKHYQFDSYVTPYVHNLIDSVVDEVFHLKLVSLPFSFDYLLAESIDMIREPLLSHHWFLFERFSIYRGVWSILLNRTKWIEAEQTTLAEGSETEGEILGLAHLAFLQKNDAEAVDYLNRINDLNITYSFWWITALSNANDWKRAAIWIKFTTDNIQKYVLKLNSFNGRRHITRVFLKEISGYCEAKNEQLYIHAMKMLLPYSYVEYDHYLLKAQDYRQWVDLQMLVGYTISDCDRQTLKLIEEVDRSALLPLYHQAVVYSLKQKNRASYKQAVKYLRKIRTCYRRLNQLDSWEMYIEKLAESNKRLRAFQEELQRAKLVVQ